MPVNELFPTTKYSQMTIENAVLGLNNLGFMYMDPRLPREKVVKSQSYWYKPSSKPALSCAATTSTGQMVVGTRNGDIRLFSEKTLKTPKKDLEQAPRAKTSLPGFGGTCSLGSFHNVRPNNRCGHNCRWEVDFGYHQDVSSGHSNRISRWKEWL